VKRIDLTSPEVFSNFLGYFWTQIFEDGEIARAIGNYSSYQLAQLYKDMVVAINSTSIHSTPVYRREIIFPVVLSKNEIENRFTSLVYGDGSIYGSQSADAPSMGEVIIFGEKYLKKDSIFCKIFGGTPPESSKAVVAVNRLYGADVMWVSGVDFEVKDGNIYFKKSPFDDSRFPKRRVKTDQDLDDEEIVLWLLEVDLDKKDVFRNFGTIFTPETKSSETYKNVCLSFFEMCSNGFSENRVRSLFAAASGSPVVREENERVLSIYSPPENPGSTSFVETDKNLYQIPKEQQDDLSSGVFVGATLNRGFALTKVVEVINPKTHPKWWAEKQAIPTANMFSIDGVKFLSFPNKAVNVEKRLSNRGNPTIRFELIGEEQSKKNFWEHFNRSEDANKETLENFPDQINPAQFLSEHIASSIIFPIDVDINKVKNSGFLFDSISSVLSSSSGMLPLYIYVYLFIKFSTSDTYSVGASIQDTFVGFSRSPGIQQDQYPEGDNPLAKETVLVKYRSKCLI
jgi:hypothetical protein